MNPLIFWASIVFSCLGVAFDNITTGKFIKDIGIEYEWNPCFRKVYKRWGYEIWILIEAFIIAAFCIVDSLVTGILFFGVFYGVFRGLVAAHNWQIISTYETVGIDAFKEHGKCLKQFSQKANHNNRVKTKLQYFACSLICVIASVLMFFIAAFESLFSAGLNFTFYPVAGLVFGVGLFLFAIGMID